MRPVAATATQRVHAQVMINRPKNQADHEARAATQLQQAANLEQDLSGNWRSRARRRQSAQRLRAAASDNQRTAHRLAVQDMPEDLPF